MANKKPDLDSRSRGVLITDLLLTTAPRSGYVIPGHGRLNAPPCSTSIRGAAWEHAMRALLYALFVTFGGLLSVLIAYLVEPKVSMTASLIVFLVLFFSNFIVSWFAVVLVMDGSLKDV